MSRKFIGPLRYLGWQHAWTIGEWDIRAPVFEAMEKFKEKRASHSSTLHSYVLEQDDHAEFIFRWRSPDHIPLLDKAEGFGFSNVHSYMDHALCRLNGRRVTLELENHMINFWADPAEDVPEIWYGDKGNDCVISGDPKDICGLGAGPENTCIFLTVGGAGSLSRGGFMCEKCNDGTARYLLDRLVTGKMNAQRIGNCKLMGRK